ncbi:MAG: BrnT family toxin [Treponema sp.]|jgi:uncharacterized DUF497 family protein|nr:BrnT family toxin [Treponema sp.]
MDTEFSFEWDEEKDRDNQMKHGVSFEEAMAIFSDSRRVEFFDSKHSFLEERWKIFGMSGSIVYMVICTERNGNIRIISAREASKFEEEDYFYGYSSKSS